jgi:hypothetical protein
MHDARSNASDLPSAMERCLRNQGKYVCAGKWGKGFVFGELLTQLQSSKNRGGGVLKEKAKSPRKKDFNSSVAASRWRPFQYPGGSTLTAYSFHKLVTYEHMWPQLEVPVDFPVSFALPLSAYLAFEPVWTNDLLTRRSPCLCNALGGRQWCNSIILS